MKRLLHNGGERWPQLRLSKVLAVGMKEKRGKSYVAELGDGFDKLSY